MNETESNTIYWIEFVQLSCILLNYSVKCNSYLTVVV